ncbi:hypothetical protein C8J57DRAFT_1585169 [Mycena rebaudengoi]|nr:hypothetical protein C8J57DRAFT_1585169 [Mycena rebaudengoi]
MTHLGDAIILALDGFGLRLSERICGLQAYGVAVGSGCAHMGENKTGIDLGKSSDTSVHVECAPGVYGEDAAGGRPGSFATATDSTRENRHFLRASYQSGRASISAWRGSGEDEDKCHRRSSKETSKYCSPGLEAQAWLHDPSRSIGIEPRIRKYEVLDVVDRVRDWACSVVYADLRSETEMRVAMSAVVGRRVVYARRTDAPSVGGVRLEVSSKYQHIFRAQDELHFAAPLPPSTVIGSDACRACAAEACADWSLQRALQSPCAAWIWVVVGARSQRWKAQCGLRWNGKPSRRKWELGCECVRAKTADVIGTATPEKRSAGQPTKASDIKWTDGNETYRLAAQLHRVGLKGIQLVWHLWQWKRRDKNNFKDSRETNTYVPHTTR